MPRKTNDAEKTIPKKEDKKSKKIAKTTVSKSATKTTKRTASATTKTTKATSKKAITTKTTGKKAATTKKATKVSSSKVRKTSTKKTVATTKKATKSKPVSITEYYDLPYRYNQTVVKILAQTPQMLFVYWDISDNNRLSFQNHYGNDFFSKTKPVLIVHNETLNYSFEIEINDFANSWYLRVNDANSKYVIELGRRPIYNSPIKDEYIFISSSNEMTAPNNHILFEKFDKNVTYKNTRTGNLSSKDFSYIQNYKNMQKIYNIYDLYKKIYKDELFNEILDNDVSNPSSNSFSNLK